MKNYSVKNYATHTVLILDALYLTGFFERKRLPHSPLQKLHVENPNNIFCFHFRAFGISNTDQRNLAKDMKIVEKRCKAKSKKYNNADRLLIDKDYLSTLSKVVFTYCIACSPNPTTNSEYYLQILNTPRKKK